MNSTTKASTALHPLQETREESFSPVLRIAAQELLESEDDSSSPVEPRKVLQARINHLINAIENRPDAIWLDSTAPEQTGDLIRLLDHLRAQVVEVWARSKPRPNVDDILSVLRSFEHAHRSLEQRFSCPAPAPADPLSAPDLVVDLAHDFRSPLTSVLFLAETLRRGLSGEVNELQHRQLGIIYSAALSMVNMASDVIELARGGDRLVDKQPSPFSISEMLDAIRDMVLPMADECRVALRMRPPSQDRYLGHPIPLSRVLLNLTTNALQATQDGFVEIVIREVERDRLEFSVRDTGNGMDEETRRDLFQPFRKRGSGTRARFSGAGLGLAICHRLVTAMGGELRYESVKGWGTNFFFVLEMPATDLS